MQFNARVGTTGSSKPRWCARKKTSTVRNVPDSAPIRQGIRPTRRQRCRRRGARSQTPPTNLPTHPPATHLPPTQPNHHTHTEPPRFSKYSADAPQRVVPPQSTHPYTTKPDTGATQRAAPCVSISTHHHIRSFLTHATPDAGASQRATPCVRTHTLGRNLPMGSPPSSSLPQARISNICWLRISPLLTAHRLAR